MRQPLIPLCMLLLLANACKTAKKPDIHNPPEYASHRPWGRIGAQTLADNYTRTPIVSKIIPLSPAQKAGLMKNDIIVSINGIDAPDLDIARYIQSRKPGAKVIFRITRSSAALKLIITVGLFPQLEQLSLMTYDNISSGDYKRARELLKKLTMMDTKQTKTRKISKLGKMLLGKDEKKLSPERALSLAQKALNKSFDLHRTAALLRIYKKSSNKTRILNNQYQKLKKCYFKLTGENP